MRPVRLELEGFTAFRERTVVDFAGVDLFALTGPTGAGKSSVIDAMIFALYGTVPRFGDDRLVGAVVSQGRTECRVRLDFDVGDERWTAVRVVRQRDGRASTREARLERAGEVVAGNATELDAEVAALLGLDAHQFMTCVVLPQGQFARFLQARPAERQTLLVRLLELGLYDTVREAAGSAPGGWRASGRASVPTSPRWPSPRRRPSPRSGSGAAGSSARKPRWRTGCPSWRPRSASATSCSGRGAS